MLPLAQPQRQAKRHLVWQPVLTIPLLTLRPKWPWHWALKIPLHQQRLAHWLLVKPDSNSWACWQSGQKTVQR